MEIDEQTQLQIALNLSKEEAKKVQVHTETEDGPPFTSCLPPNPSGTSPVALQAQTKRTARLRPPAACTTRAPRHAKSSRTLPPVSNKAPLSCFTNNHNLFSSLPQSSEKHPNPAVESRERVLTPLLDGVELHAM